MTPRRRDLPPGRWGHPDHRHGRRGWTVGIAVTIIVVGVLVGLMFRTDWEERLAKAVVKGFSKPDVVHQRGVSDSSRSALPDRQGHACATTPPRMAPVDDAPAAVLTFVRAGSALSVDLDADVADVVEDHPRHVTAGPPVMDPVAL